LFTSTNLKKFEKPWSEKVPVAFFRGSATGGGVTCETNQRLRVAEIDFLWSQHPDVNGSNHHQNGNNGNNNNNINNNNNNGYPFLDAKIVGWNMRDKKIAQGRMTFIHRKDFSLEGGKQFRVPIYEQSRYKYILYIEGHCAACRYAFMMSLGSVILRVQSTCVADQMWYFPLLRNGYDHLSIDADFGNLREVLDWCHTHDEECQRIAANARRLYEQYISRDGILDYLQSVTVEVAKRWRNYSPCWHNPHDEITQTPAALPAPVVDFQRFVADQHDQARSRGGAGNYGGGRGGMKPTTTTTTTTTTATTVADRKRKFRELYSCVDNPRSKVIDRRCV
jgi:hypothetical protein